MKVFFGDKRTARLYDGGRLRKGDPQPEVVEGLQDVLELVFSAGSTLELRQIESLHYEDLSGKLKGWSSVRVHGQYRLVFKEEKGRDPALTDVKLSKHYAKNPRG